MLDKDKTKIKITDLLKSHSDGLTIAEIMDRTGQARHTVLARLHSLIGEGKVRVRQINMAKLHYWNEPVKEEEMGGKVEIVPLAEEHIKQIPPKPEKKPKQPLIDMEKIKSDIEEELRGGKIKKHQAQIKEQRKPIEHIVEKTKEPVTKLNKNYVN